MKTIIDHRPERLPLSIACQALGINRSSLYAWRKRMNNDIAPRRSRKAATQPRALSPQERTHVIKTLHSEPYRDQPPAEVYQRLLEKDQYLCSISTMHRLLRQVGENGERRPQRPAQHHAVPRLLARKPNEVWTWDITKLPLICRRIYLSLYVVLDLYSRFVVAWMLSTKENSALAQQLMNEATTRYRIIEGQLTLHQDRGSPMTAHGYLENMNALDITCSHSRPRVSNDNPFSESQFKTQKYQPDYPGRFDSQAHAQRWCEDYFDWYNFKHHHSGLAGFTPEQVFTGRYRDVAKQKQRALDARFETNPERFVKGRPQVKMPPEFVAINPLTAEEASELGVSDKVNFPTLTAAGYVSGN
ncbi:MAG: IS3 family transposase [Thiomicrorhabdus sp.]|nr:IS3 family transposase [Thiomicrorhabdus sp.]